MLLELLALDEDNDEPRQEASQIDRVCVQITSSNSDSQTNTDEGVRGCVSHCALKKTLFDTISEIDAECEEGKVEQYFHIL